MPSAPTALVSASDVSWRVGYRWIVRNVTLEVARRDVLLLVGGNGTGKTSLIRLVAGLVSPTRGTIERRANVGMVAHHSMLYDALTARENLAFAATLHGVSRERPAALLDQMGLTPAADQRIATFSRGMLQRLAIARALLHEPDVLLLDEPLSGLDEAGTRVVVDVLTQLRDRGCAVIIATHQLVELLDVATSIAFMVGGAVVACETPDGRDAGAIVNRYRTLLEETG